MLGELRTLLEQYEQSRGVTLDGDDFEKLAAADLANAVRELLNEQTNVQALALARLVRQRPDEVGLMLQTRVFDLPDGYWAVEQRPSYFSCGIAPNGDVSS